MILLLDSNLVHAMDPDLDYILIGYCSGFNPNRIAGGQKIREKFLCFHHDNLKAWMNKISPFDTTNSQVNANDIFKKMPIQQNGDKSR